jgi:hypothetical protein
VTHSVWHKLRYLLFASKINISQSLHSDYGYDFEGLPAEGVGIKLSAGGGGAAKGVGVQIVDAR